MKCPLTYGGVARSGRLDTPIVEDCLKEECAWWDNQDKRCALATIAGCLKTHLGWMGEIENMMHKGGELDGSANEGKS